jgi:hypothetical protein
VIAISPENYNILKEQGKTGDSFNDVLNNILAKVCPPSGQESRDKLSVAATTSKGGSYNSNA